MSAKLPKIDRCFVGAIKLSIWLKRHNYFADPTQPSNLSEGTIWPSFAKAVATYKDKDIHLYFVDWMDDVSLSMIDEQSNCYDIIVPTAFNPCHRRFAICKELCHILTDDVDKGITVECNPFIDLNRAVATARLVRQAAELLGKNPLFTDEQLTSEDFCFVLALELLIPIKDREVIVNWHDAGIIHYNIAYHLRIPEKLVDFFVESRYNQEWRRAGGFKMLDAK